MQVVSSCNGSPGRLLISAVLCVSSAVCAQAAENEVAGERPGLGLRPTVYPELPFDLAQVESIDKAELSEDARAVLSQRGFVVVGPRHGSMPECYPTAGIPLVTIDSVLEVYLSDFEIAWGELETQQAHRFTRLQVELWDALVARFDRLPEGAARAAGERLLGLVAVGRALSRPDWTIPSKLPDGVDADALRAAWKADLGLANAHEGSSESVLWRRAIDWSVFRPVGAYADNETIANYFRSSQWWGRQGLRTAEREERLCAGILMWVLEDASPFDPSGDDEFWHGFLDDSDRIGPLRTFNEINRSYDEFFEDADDLTVTDLSYRRHDPRDETGLNLPQDLGTDEFDDWLQDVFGRLRIPEQFREWDLSDNTPARRRGQGLRLLAPRVTTASHVFSRVTAPSVPGRLLPRGLDLLAALGDDRARALTLEYEAFSEARDALAAQLDKLRAEKTGFGLTFPRCLDQMCAALANPRPDERAPLFARTPAYHDRSLASALACWAGAREIYFVRVLSGGGVGGGGVLVGIADPNLDGWQRLIELCHVTSRAFGRARVEFAPTAMDWALTYRRLAEKLLRGEPLTHADRWRFLNYFDELENAIRVKAIQDVEDERFPEGWPVVDRRVAVEFGRSRMPDQLRFAGKACCRIYAIVEYDGRLHLCQGGVFDYCEFDRPAGTSISRDEFRRLMDSEDAPAAPAWTRSYRVDE